MLCYLASFIVLADSQSYAKISQGLGVLVVMAFAFEVLSRGDFATITSNLRESVGPVFPFLIFLGVFSVFAMVSPYAQFGIQRINTIFQLFVLLFVVYYLVRREGETWFIQWGFLIGLGVIAVLGAGQMSLAVESGDRFSFDPTGQGTEEDSMNPNRFAQYSNIFILLAIKAIFIDVRLAWKRGTSKILVLVSVAFSVLCAYQIIFATGSRKGIILLFLLCAGGAIVYFRGHLTLGRIFGGVGLGVAALAGTLLLLVQSEHLERFRTLFDFGSIYVREVSLLTREEMYLAGLKMWVQSPIWGQGFEAFRLTEFGTYSHSNYIELLANHGIIGFVVFYALHFVAIKRGWYIFKNGPRFSRERVAWGFCCLGLVLFWDVAAVSYLSKANVIVLGLGIGYIMYLHDVSRRLAISERRRQRSNRLGPRLAHPTRFAGHVAEI